MQAGGQKRIRILLEVYLERAPSQGLDGSLVGVDLVLEAEARVVNAEDVIVASARQLPPAVGPLETADLLRAGRFPGGMRHHLLIYKG